MAAHPETNDQLAGSILRTMRTRRVVRRFTAEPVGTELIRKVLEAGRWATTGGNRRVHRFLVVRDPRTIRLVKAMSPGMLGVPAAIIAICLDAPAAEEQQVPVDRHPSVWIDVGTAAMNMMVAAHAFGLGSCPVTSFSRSGVSTMLELPATAVPQMLILLGHPAPYRRVLRPGAPTRVTVDDLTYWERYGHQAPSSLDRAQDSNE